jgi:FSR family fosmidomycin resistance protein-like MFS transporter
MVHMDLGTAGLIAGGCALLGEASQLLFGAWSDRGYRRQLIAAGIVMSCAALGVVYCDAAWAMFPFLLVCYMGSAAFHPAAAGLVGGLSQRHKALFVTIFASGGSFGMAAGQIGFYMAYRSLGNGVSLLILPSLLLVVLVAFFAFPAMKSATSGPPVRFRAMSKLFGQRDLRFLYLALACNTTLFFGFMFLLPDLLLSRGYADWICFGGGHLTMVLGGATMMIPSGFLADRYSSRSVILGGILLGLAFFYVFLWLPQVESFVLLALLYVLGALLGIVHPVGVALANQLLPKNPGLVSAFAMGMVWCIAECFGPATSLLTKLFPPQNATTNALLILATLNILGAWAAVKLPSRQQSQEVSLDLV